MEVNSVHKVVDVNSGWSVCRYTRATIASVAILALTWIQLDIAESIRYFFTLLLNSVQ